MICRMISLWQLDSPKSAHVGQVALKAWLAYLVVTFMGFADGNPAKLYLPRDYSGAYCGVATRPGIVKNMVDVFGIWWDVMVIIWEFMGYSLQLTKLVLTIASCNKLPESYSLDVFELKDLGKNLENNFRNIFSFFFPPLGGAKGFLEIVGFTLAT